MADDIKARLQLTGGDEIKKTLLDLGSTGERVFNQLDQASRLANSGLGSISETSNKLQSALARFGSVGNSIKDIGSKLASISAAFGVGLGVGGGGIVAGIITLATSSAKATEEVGNLATATGSSTEEMSGMINALSQLGVNTDELQRGFSRLAVRISAEWPVIQQQIRASSDNIRQSILNVEQAQVQAETAAKAFARTQGDIAKQQISDANSVESAKLSLLEAQNKLGVNGFGIKTGPDPAVTKEIADRRELLDVEQAKLRLDQAEEQQRRNAADAAAKAEQAAIAAETAQLNLSKARREAADAQANDINNLRRYIEDLAKGFADTGSKLNLTTDNIVKGIIASVGPGVKALSQLGDGFGNLSQQTPSVRAVVLQLASIFQNMRDESQKTAVAVALLGRELGPALVRALSGGPDALLDEENRVKGLGLALTDADRKVAESLNRSREALGDTANDIKNKVGIAFGPVTTRLIDGFRQAFETNFARIQSAAQTIAQNLEPAITAIINILKGVSFEDFAKTSSLSPEQLLKVQEWQQSIDQITAIFKGFGSAVVAVFKDFIIPGVSLALAALNKLASAINTLFGTKFTGDELGLALIAGQFTGINALVISLGVAIRGLLGPIALVALGIAAWKHSAEDSLKAIQENQSNQKPDSLGIGAGVASAASSVWDAIKSAATTAWDAVVNIASVALDKVIEIATGLASRITGAVAGVVDALASPFRSASSEIAGIVDDIVRRIQSAIDLAAQLASAAAQAGSGGFDPTAGSGATFSSGGWTGPLGRNRIAGVVHGQEYVQPAHVVAKPGVLAFMEILRRTGDLARTIEYYTRGYSLGGFVESVSSSLSPAALPGFAGGGFVPAPRAASFPELGTIKLDFGGGAAFSVLAPEDIARGLGDYAAKKSLRSAGRRAGWEGKR